MPTYFVRNDDVNILDRELVEVTQRCVNEGVPIVHAVEPANITDETVAWLRDQKRQHGRLIEIMQHGYDHRKRGKGEFGGTRTYEDQYRDLRRGRELLEDKFGTDFSPCANFPFGPYNEAAIRALDDLGFRVVNSHYNKKMSRRIFYAFGHLARRGRLLDRHVSWNLRDYPGTSLFCIDVSISFIGGYVGQYGSRECHFNTASNLIASTLAYANVIPVVGMVLHHRFHTTSASNDLISEVLQALKATNDSEFLNLEEIHARFRPGAGWGFRNEI